VKVVDVTPSSRELIAPACRACAWWQHTPGSARRDRGEDAQDVRALEADRRVRADWERRVDRAVGLFGKALVDEDAVLGWMQAAPSPLVPRARSLPAGPPSPDAWLIMCTYFYDEEYLGGFQRLLHELLADLKRREATALEAFALCETSLDDRFRSYLRESNLFNHEMLEGSGFRPVRLFGEVGRYRLDLATLIAEPRRVRVLERIEHYTAAQPV
jgi:hypothetical protein